MLWVKAFHIIAMVCWFAGLFYLPRLFVYHAMAQAESDSASQARFCIMERKLYRGIMNPSMLATVGLGLWMLIEGWNRYFHQATWMHIKLFLVILLVGYHLACGHMMRRFAADLNRHTDRYYRVFNELPVIILVAVVLLAILKQPL